MNSYRIRWVTAVAALLMSALPAQDLLGLMDNAREELAAERWAAARALLETVLEHDDTYAPAHFELSKLAITVDDLTGAQKHIDAAVEAQPRNEDYRAHAERIDALSSLMSNAHRSYTARDFLDAVSIYEKVIDSHPDFANAYYGMGKAFAEAELQREAAQAFRQARDLNPSDPRYGSALNKLAADKYNLGNRAYRSRDWESAIQVYQETIELNPEFHQAYLQLARAYLRWDDNDVDAAIGALDRCLTVKPDYISAYVEKGNILRRDGRYADSEAVFRQALAIDARSDRVLVGLGSVVKRDDARMEEAVEVFKQALAVNPKSGDAAEYLGEIYSEQKSWDSAHKYLVIAVDLKSKSHIAAWRLAHVYNALGDFDQALLSAKRSTELKKSFEYAWYEKGLADKALGNRQAAIAAFREAKKGRDASIRKSADYELKQLDPSSQ